MHSLRCNLRLSRRHGAQRPGQRDNVCVRRDNLQRDRSSKLFTFNRSAMGGDQSLYWLICGYGMVIRSRRRAIFSVRGSSASTAFAVSL